jgi:hypothetical protein
MRALRQAFLSAGLALLAIAALSVPAADCQTSSAPPAPASRKADLAGRAQAVDSDAASQPKSITSVLGIEVRSSLERNIGRIVDLLADRRGDVEAAVVEFGGFLGIGTRKIAIEWSVLRFETEGKRLVAILDIPRDQLRTAPDYKSDQPTVVTRIIKPVLPATEEPPYKAGPPLPVAKKTTPSKHRRHQRRQEPD